ncbi:MAG TPA: DUF5317 family protein [Candidatus Limnocylindrales bacterium]|nr:DUF5317 family protein [Candidatus Limnocylindrales bacterium]
MIEETPSPALPTAGRQFRAARSHAQGTTRVVWALGVASGIGMVALSAATVAPYPVSWPWISFLALAILEEVLIGPADGRPSAGPRIVMIATIIMFRKHPDLIALVTAGTGLAAGVLTRQPWDRILTRTASLLVLAAVGTIAMRVVGYADPGHFVAATAVLILLYVLAVSRQPLPGGERRAGAAQGVRWLGVGALGAGLALAWRTPATGPLMLRLSEVAFLAVIGITIGFARRGNPRAILSRRLRLRRFPAVAVLGAVTVLVSTQLPGQAGWIVAAIGLTAIGGWAVRQGWFPVACLLLGGLCNEIARGVNGGRMPVATAGLSPTLGEDLGNLTDSSSLYRTVDAHTHLAWLADRFPLTPFPGVASPGDLLLAAGIVWTFASLTRADEPHDPRMRANPDR